MRKWICLAVAACAVPATEAGRPLPLTPEEQVAVNLARLLVPPEYRRNFDRLTAETADLVAVVRDIVEERREAAAGEVPRPTEAAESPEAPEPSEPSRSASSPEAAEPPELGDGVTLSAALAFVKDLPIGRGTADKPAAGQGGASDQPKDAAADDHSEAATSIEAAPADETPADAPTAREQAAAVRSELDATDAVATPADEEATQSHSLRDVGAAQAEAERIAAMSKDRVARAQAEIAERKKQAEMFQAQARRLTAEMETLRRHIAELEKRGRGGSNDPGQHEDEQRRRMESEERVRWAREAITRRQQENERARVEHRREVLGSRPLQPADRKPPEDADHGHDEHAHADHARGDAGHGDREAGGPVDRGRFGPREERHSEPAGPKAAPPQRPSGPPRQSASGHAGSFEIWRDKVDHERPEHDPGHRADIERKVAHLRDEMALMVAEAEQAELSAKMQERQTQALFSRLKLASEKEYAGVWAVERLCDLYGDGASAELQEMLPSVESDLLKRYIHVKLIELAEDDREAAAKSLRSLIVGQAPTFEDSGAFAPRENLTPQFWPDGPRSQAGPDRSGNDGTVIFGDKPAGTRSRNSSGSWETFESDDGRTGRVFIPRITEGGQGFAITILPEPPDEEKPGVSPQPVDDVFLSPGEPFLQPEFER